MSINHKEYFLGLNEQFSSVIQDSFDSKLSTRLADIFHLSEDLNTWASILNRNTDTTILISAIQEFELGFQASISGQYRYAFMAHRYFLEQVFRFVYLSSNELHLRHWKLGLRDITWGSLINIDDGIFSKNFIRAFYLELESYGVQMISISEKLYRESSEFIHGNFSKVEILPKSISFNESLLNQWLDFMDTSRFIAQFLLFMRFSKELNKGELECLESILKEEMSGIDAFSTLLM